MKVLTVALICAIVVCHVTAFTEEEKEIVRWGVTTLGSGWTLEKINSVQVNQCFHLLSTVHMDRILVVSVQLPIRLLFITFKDVS